MRIRTYYEGGCSLGTKFKTAMSSIFDYWLCYLKRNSNNTQSILSFSKTQLDPCSSAAFFGILQTISKVLGRVFDSFPNRLNDFRFSEGSSTRFQTLRYLRKVSYLSNVLWSTKLILRKLSMEVLSLRKKCCMLFNESHNVSACVDCQAHAHVVCRIRSIVCFYATY